MSGQIDPLFENHPEVVERKRQQTEFMKQMFAPQRSGRPTGSNADEWHLFLSEYLDNRATSPNGLPFMAVQIAEALDEIDRLKEAKRQALSVADERSKENVRLRAELANARSVLEMAQSCIRGETPEDMTHDEAREYTVSKIREVILP